VKLSNDGRWFYFNPDNSSEGGVKIKLPFNKKEEDVGNEDFWDEAILDWHNVEDDDGNEIACTKENKNHLMKTSPMFIAFINKFFTKLNKDYIKYKEYLEKN
jgi:hypothetical protein